MQNWLWYNSIMNLNKTFIILEGVISCPIVLNVNVTMKKARQHVLTVKWHSWKRK
ncbi:protein of unknown function [Petrocella atlantisensis]|uniref:Uncharacterized protein n=1 Tax=Petrocella atlantisensis TaxID=2173034 RepID=A0A3P7PG07_9FIRM|nr:protein of unknown function [Petrocella atlantisensis]